MRARPSPEPWDWGNGSLHMLAHDDISQDARSHKLCVSCQKQTCLQNRVAGMSCVVICRRRKSRNGWGFCFFPMQYMLTTFLFSHLSCVIRSVVLAEQKKGGSCISEVALGNSVCLRACEHGSH